MIFLDSPSTTPLDASVLDAMLPYLRMEGGNERLFGQAERSSEGAAVRSSRETVASLLNCLPNEILWTSGATEANNLAILGFAGNRQRPGRVVSQLTEHSAVLEPLRHLAKIGWDIDLLPVDQLGHVSLDALRNAVSKPTDLVSIMWGNNEIGTLQPITEIARLCAERGISFHCDAAQAVGKVPIDLAKLPITMLTLSAHKMYGPVGVGALFVKDLAKKRSIVPLLFGGGQEHGLRPGTLNVLAIVGFGAACRLASDQMAIWTERLEKVRDRFESRLFDQLQEIEINGDTEKRLPHISNIAFHGADSEGLLAMLPDIVASTGSACHYADFAPSHVLTALNKCPQVTDCSLRFGFTKDTTEREIDYAAERIAQAVSELRTDAGG